MAARPRLKVVTPKPFAVEGERFRAFVDARWGRANGGIRGLASESGTTPETLYAWFRGDNLPGLGSVRTIAKALDARVLELVAAIEGEPVPEPQETAPPEWAERLLTGVMALERKQSISDAELDRAEALAAAWLATAEQQGRHRPGSGGAGGASGA